ncbi:uncharacterized protein Bfra_006102 [Botrytis fragariae]|uniref:Uncharacterized protein n=1 Tax=Botrytis fragariae TaxID=1964551 RepID=A0A8H6ASC3_9HELO|nr:uncharacterized protein Bfra_006102 [Botrytis fragariae]KAF5872739.1 hypothetical protein Bfra_006102 [Botrytis fragariae]
MASRIKDWILKRLPSTNDAQNLRGNQCQKAKISDSPVIDTKFRHQLSIDDVPKSSKAYDSDDSREETSRSGGKTCTQCESAEAPIVLERRQDTTKAKEHDEKCKMATADGDIQDWGREFSSSMISGFVRRSPPFLQRKISNVLRSLPRPISIECPDSIHTLPKLPNSAHSLQAYESLPMPVQSVQNHKRHSSRSPTSYIDVLDAHDSLKGGRGNSRNRAMAAGVRIYGENVANRTLAMENSQADPSNPQFSYLRLGCYGVAETEGSKHSRPRLPEFIPKNDDTKTSQQDPSYIQSVSESLFSLTGSPPETILDGTAPDSYASNFDRHQGDLETLPYIFEATHCTSSIREARRRAFVFTQSHPIHSVSRREASNIINSSSSTFPMKETLRANSVRDRDTSHSTSTTTSARHNHDLSSENGVSGTVSDRTPRSMPLPSKYTPFPTDKNVETKGNGDDMHVNGTKFPIADGQKHTSTSSSMPDHFGMNGSYLIGERAEPIGLEGVVDLNNTVDTTVHEKVAPAVVHEHILPTSHEIITKEIHREIHQHHWYHRVLPVIDTEVLPAKHYVYGDDGDTLVRIPESMVRGHTITGTYSRNWSIVHQPPQAPAEDPFNSPLFGVEPELPNTKYTTHFQPDSKGGLQWSHVPGEPVKVMEREYITAEGFPRKETWWRYPPVMATAAQEAGLTVPMHWNHVPAGKEQTVTQAPVSTPKKEKKIKELRDLEHAQVAEYNSIDHIDSNMQKVREQKLYDGLSDSDSKHARELNGMQSRLVPRKPVANQQTYERPPTRDSGYGGLDGSPSSAGRGPSHYRDTSGSSVSSLLGRVRGEDGIKSTPVDGEATKYLQRMREKRRSSGASSGTTSRSWGRRSEDFQRGPNFTLPERPKKPEHHFGAPTAL